MKLPPVIIVHSLSDARLALMSARPVTLLSAPGAALYGGCLWWAALMEQAGVKGLSLLDCADAPGRAVEALRLGLPGIVLNCEPENYAAVAGIAAANGAVLLSRAPPALDLALRGSERRILTWLSDTGSAMG